MIFKRYDFYSHKDLKKTHPFTRKLIFIHFVFEHMAPSSKVKIQHEMHELILKKNIYKYTSYQVLFYKFWSHSFVKKKERIRQMIYSSHSITNKSKKLINMSNLETRKWRILKKKIWIAPQWLYDFGIWILHYKITCRFKI